jgi:metallo-beta-lactamase class B
MIRVAAFSVLVLCVVACLGAAQRLPAHADAPALEPPPDNSDWFEPTEPQRIVGPIHYVGTLGLGAYLITTHAGHILLDGATPKSAPLIEASIRKLGFKPEEIRILLITHAHFDHAGTLAAFKKLSGAQVAVMAPDDRLLASGGTTDYLFASDEKFHFPPVDADRVLKDGDTVTLGGVTLTARLTPGHTRGCTTWITTVDDDGRSCRVAFPGSTSVNPGTRFVHDPSYPGIADDYRRALDLLDSLRPDIFLTAHASACDFAAKRQRVAAEGTHAFVDPDGYRRMLAAAREKFETQVANESSGLGGTSSGSR